METILYKRDSKGRIQQWTIEVVDSKFRTHEGLVDGIISTNAWKISTAKNIGKRNEVASNIQAIKEAESKITKKIENGYTKNIKDVDNVDIFFEPMLAHKFENFTETCYSQPKLDGIRMIVMKEGSFSRKGKQFVSVKHIEKMLSCFFSLFPDIVLDGEIYNHSLKSDFNKIVSLAKKQKMTNEDEKLSEKYLEYHIYDIYDKNKPNMTFEERFTFIQSNLMKIDFVKIVETDIVTSKDILDNLYSKYIEMGFEGQMIRTPNSSYKKSRSKDLLKRKEFVDEEFEILDISSGVGNWYGKAKSISFINKNGNTFSTGLKGSMEYATDLLENKEKYIGKLGTVRFQEYTKDDQGNDNVPRFGVLYSIRTYE